MHCTTDECTSCSVIAVPTTEPSLSGNQANSPTPHKPNINCTLQHHIAMKFVEYQNYHSYLIHPNVINYNYSKNAIT